MRDPSRSVAIDGESISNASGGIGGRAAPPPDQKATQKS